MNPSSSLRERESLVYNMQHRLTGEGAGAVLYVELLGLRSKRFVGQYATRGSQREGVA